MFRQTGKTNTFNNCFLFQPEVPLPKTSLEPTSSTLLTSSSTSTQLTSPASTASSSSQYSPWISDSQTGFDSYETGYDQFEEDGDESNGRKPILVTQPTTPIVRIPITTPRSTSSTSTEDESEIEGRTIFTF